MIRRTRITNIYERSSKMKRKRKGFTLVELLVVIAIIAMLMSILMPALAKVKAIAQRLVCGTNLSGIGKAMAMYATEYDDALPVAGGPECTWVTSGTCYINDWMGLDGADDWKPEWKAYGRPGINRATISASLYYLVKYEEVPPKTFICKGDVGAGELTARELPTDFEFADMWDFAEAESGGRCTYAYHMQYAVTSVDAGGGTDAGFAITSLGDPGSPIAADRNPYFDENVTDEYLGGYEVGACISGGKSIKGPNPAAHQYEKYNVLFLDAHVEAPDGPCVGVNENNIWLYGDDTITGEEGFLPREIGGNPTDGVGIGGPMEPAGVLDAYLVNDCQE